MKRVESMDVREAVAAAKTYLSQVFEGEDISQVRLEEVEFDEAGNAWLITLGVMRPSEAPYRLPENSLTGLLEHLPRQRAYKIIRIPNDGRQPSIKIREVGVDA